MEVNVTPETYVKEICSARTFVDYRDLRQLMSMGLVKGGSLDNAAIIHEGAIICKGELRFKDEIVRHKILDLIGDIYLCGKRVKANIIAIKPGHYFNVQLANAMLKQQ
jgi:UDP-3-O-acyl-N-acetylglucosamine deacetylase